MEENMAVDKQSSDKAVTVKVDGDLLESVEESAQQDFRNVSAQMRYLISLGLRERARREAASQGETQIHPDFVRAK